MRIVDTEEEVQVKGICNIFNKIITENFPNLKKVLPIQVQETSRTPNRLDQTELLHGILSLSQEIQRTEKNMEVCKREKPNNI
jgi:hypothetical protein